MPLEIRWLATWVIALLFEGMKYLLHPSYCGTEALEQSCEFPSFPIFLQ